VDALNHKPDLGEPIRAAGGVVARPGANGRPRVAVVHRPRHNDWSLPKGKLHPGEHPVTAARREVEEETGVRAAVGIRLPSVSYQVALSRAPDAPLADKVVDFWAMRFEADGGFTAGRETDELAWLDVDEARTRLSYDRDVVVLNAFAALPPVRDPIVVVRHALAGDPEAWTGSDAERPLDAEGAARAAALAEPLACFAPVRLVSAPPLRCVQTLEPLAHLLRANGRPAMTRGITVDAAFGEDADPTVAAARLRAFAALPGGTVICSQGKLIPPLLAVLTGGTAASYPTRKGGAWVLSFDATSGVVVDPLP
jgi:8-oxo-dGTP pyrophosphatase MutT (NUDIX family)/phosphohistidine phosphatase SixA